MSYWSLFTTYPRYLSYGLLHSFFSGFGQTFLIALFVPYFREAFSLDSEEFGIIYSQATLVSAFLIPLIGPFIDNVNLKGFSYFTGLGIITACLVLGSAQSLVTLFIGLALIRLMGQGLMSHINVTAISRFFDKTRGRALSVSQLGFPLSEAIWPILVTGILSVAHWRTGFFAMAAMIALVFFPLSYFLIDAKEKFSSGVLVKRGKLFKSNIKILWRETMLFRHPFFFLVLPLSLLPPFLLTGVFINQTDIASLKNWSMGTMASSFFGFAIFRLAFSFGVGPLVDRFTAQRLLPFTLIPHILAFLLFGIGVGTGMNIKSALWPEVFGTKHLGKIRSFIAPLAVLSTAVAPWVFGWYFSHYKSLDGLVWSSVGVMLTATVLAALAKPPQGE